MTCDEPMSFSRVPLVPMLRMGTPARKLRFLLRPQDAPQPHDSGSRKRSLVPSSRSVLQADNFTESLSPSSTSITSRSTALPDASVSRPSAAFHSSPRMRFIWATNSASRSRRNAVASERPACSAAARTVAPFANAKSSVSSVECLSKSVIVDQSFLD